MAALIAWKPRYSDPRVASTRIRCLNPLAELQAQGYPIELFNRRRADEYAAVVYSKRYDDATYDEAKALQKRGVRVVLDLCDNHFYNPNGLASLRSAAAQLRRMMALADALVASTAAMADVMRAELSTPRSITIIEDAVETEIRGVRSPFWQRWWESREVAILLRRLAAGYRDGRTPLVWFGIHGGPNAKYGMLDLLKLRPLLEKLSRSYPLSLTVISNSRKKYNRAIKSWPFPTHYLNWSADTLFTALRAHAIAVIPVSENPFTRCKSNNRLALSLNVGLAVVADSIPSYQDFAEVCCLDNWETGLENYLFDSELRRRHVERGQTIIARDWSPRQLGEKWRNFFDTLIAKRTTHASTLRYQEIAPQGLQGQLE